MPGPAGRQRSNDNHLGLGELIMLVWKGSPVSDSVEREFDESEFEEDEELGGEQDESDEGELDDEDSGEDEYAEYAEYEDDEVRRPSHPRRADWDG